MSDLEIVLVNASVEVDDETVTIEGDSLSLKEGQGGDSVKAASRGSRVVIVASKDITTRVGMIKFEMPASIASMNLARDIKARGPGRVVRISGTDEQGNVLGRTMTQGVMTNDPEKAIQNEGKVALEFSGAPLTPS